MAGSPPKRSRHAVWLSTNTFGPPGTSSAGWRARPRIAVTPRVSKNAPDTPAYAIRAVSPWPSSTAVHVEAPTAAIGVTVWLAAASASTSR